MAYLGHEMFNNVDTSFKRKFLQQLVNMSKVTQGYLAIYSSDFQPAVHEPFGGHISDIQLIRYLHYDS